ncbi:hypothetical protein SUNI508_10004 [Seiridium unicorne]|uniref:Rhodopsin domain-containing protein n=1 Tax=Seiridium unicorne TaxID=138068 RepID=A0ABR2UN78_9PEZI
MSSNTLTGEEIAAISYTLPALNPTGLGAAIEVVSILLAIITTIIVGLRVWVRAGLARGKTESWGVDDYLLVVGFLPFWPSIIIGAYATRYGLGLRDSDIPTPIYVVRTNELFLYWELNYFVSANLVKCAIGLLCIRIDQRRAIRWSIAINISIIIITAILVLTFLCTWCRPLAATWNPALGKCTTYISWVTVGTITSAVQLITDVISAAIPWFVVARLQMPRRRKISVMIILGLGILASVATCFRMPFLKYFDTSKYPHNYLYHAGVVVLSSNIECSLAMIACSLPPLRALFKHYYGSTRSFSSTSSSGSCAVKLTSVTTHTNYESSTRIRASHGAWDRLEDEHCNRGGILKQMDVYITKE